MDNILNRKDVDTKVEVPEIDIVSTQQGAGDPEPPMLDDTLPPPSVPAASEPAPVDAGLPLAPPPTGGNPLDQAIIPLDETTPQITPQEVLTPPEGLPTPAMMTPLETGGAPQTNNSYTNYDPAVYGQTVTGQASDYWREQLKNAVEFSAMNMMRENSEQSEAKRQLNLAAPHPKSQHQGTATEPAWHTGLINKIASFDNPVSEFVARFIGSTENKGDVSPIAGSFGKSGTGAIGAANYILGATTSLAQGVAADIESRSGTDLFGNITTGNIGGTVGDLGKLVGGVATSGIKGVVSVGKGIGSIAKGDVQGALDNLMGLGKDESTPEITVMGGYVPPLTKAVNELRSRSYVVRAATGDNFSAFDKEPLYGFATDKNDSLQTKIAKGVGNLALDVAAGGAFEKVIPAIGLVLGKGAKGITKWGDNPPAAPKAPKGSPDAPKGSPDAGGAKTYDVEPDPWSGPSSTTKNPDATEVKSVVDEVMSVVEPAPKAAGASRAAKNPNVTVKVPASKILTPAPEAAKPATTAVLTPDAKPAKTAVLAPPEGVAPLPGPRPTVADAPVSAKAGDIAEALLELKPGQTLDVAIAEPKLLEAPKVEVEVKASTEVAPSAGAADEVTPSPVNSSPAQATKPAKGTKFDYTPREAANLPPQNTTPASRENPFVSQDGVEFSGRDMIRTFDNRPFDRAVGVFDDSVDAMLSKDHPTLKQLIVIAREHAGAMVELQRTRLALERHFAIMDFTPDVAPRQIVEAIKGDDALVSTSERIGRAMSNLLGANVKFDSDNIVRAVKTDEYFVRLVNSGVDRATAAKEASELKWVDGPVKDQLSPEFQARFDSLTPSSTYGASPDKATPRVLTSSEESRRTEDLLRSEAYTTKRGGYLEDDGWADAEPDVFQPTALEAVSARYADEAGKARGERINAKSADAARELADGRQIHAQRKAALLEAVKNGDEPIDAGLALRGKADGKMIRPSRLIEPLRDLRKRAEAAFAKDNRRAIAAAEYARTGKESVEALPRGGRPAAAEIDEFSQGNKLKGEQYSGYSSIDLEKQADALLKEEAKLDAAAGLSKGKPKLKGQGEVIERPFTGDTPRYFHGTRKQGVNLSEGDALAGSRHEYGPATYLTDNIDEATNNAIGAQGVAGKADVHTVSIDPKAVIVLGDQTLGGSAIAAFKRGSEIAFNPSLGEEYARQGKSLARWLDAAPRTFNQAYEEVVRRFESATEAYGDEWNERAIAGAMRYINEGLSASGIDGVKNKGGIALFDASALKVEGVSTVGGAEPTLIQAATARMNASSIAASRSESRVVRARHQENVVGLVHKLGEQAKLTEEEIATKVTQAVQGLGDIVKAQRAEKTRAVKAAKAYRERLMQSKVKSEEVRTEKLMETGKSSGCL